MGASGWVHVDFDAIERETDAAFLFVIDGDEVWIPKSQIADADDYTEGTGCGTVSITEWIANEKGLG